MTEPDYEGAINALIRWFHFQELTQGQSTIVALTCVGRLAGTKAESVVDLATGLKQLEGLLRLEAVAEYKRQHQ